jgi:type IV pilus assembly protein PilB
MPKEDSVIANRRLGDLLVAHKVMSAREMETVCKGIPTGDRNLPEYLSAWGYLPDADVVSIIGKALKLPKVGLDTAQPDPEALSRIPVDVCVEYLILPVEIMRGKFGRQLVLAMANPLDTEAIQKAAQQSDLRIKPFVASASELRQSIGRCYRVPVPKGPREMGVEAPTIDEKKTVGVGNNVESNQINTQHGVSDHRDIEVILGQLIEDALGQPDNQAGVLEALTQARAASDSYGQRLLYGLAHHLLSQGYLGADEVISMLEVPGQTR